MQPTDLSDVSDLLSLVQNPDDLLFRESLALHLISNQPKRLTQRLDSVSQGRPRAYISEWRTWRPEPT